MEVTHEPIQGRLTILDDIWSQPIPKALCESIAFLIMLSVAVSIPYTDLHKSHLHPLQEIMILAQCGTAPTINI